MKKILIDTLFGILTVIGVTVFEFLVTLPFTEHGNLSPDEYSPVMNREFLLTALPAGIVTFIFTWLLKTKYKVDAKRRACIWTVILTLNYVITGLGNGNFSEIFSTVGIYILLACAFAGPIAYAVIKRLK